MIIYLDQYMILNALFDGMILYAGGMGSRKKGSRKRMVVCTVAGSLSGTLFTWLDGGRRSLWWGIVQFIFLLSAYAVVYQQYQMKELILGTVKMLIGACLLAGLFWSWKEHWRLQFFPMVMAGTGICLFLPLLDTLWLDCQTRRLLCQVSVSVRGRKITGTGLWDTGNRLVEPASGKPVLIAEKEMFCQVFSENEWEEIRDFAHSGYYHPENISCLLFRIPYRSVGNTGYLTAVKVDRVEINGAGKKQSGQQILIALYDGKLSSTNDYQFILQNIAN